MSQKKPPVASILIEKISFELSKQARVQDDDSKVDEYAAAIEAGEELPPVELYREMLPEPNPLKSFVYLIGDGWKRIRAHLKQGLVLIDAHIYETGRAGAIKHACRANTSKQHGVVRTQADARNAIQIYLLESDWYLDSDPLIAKYCEVDHKTVATVRERLEKEGKIPVTTERRGADGKMYPAKQQKQGGNSHPEVQPSLLINNPIQSSQRVGAAFDEAEQKQTDARVKTPTEPSTPAELSTGDSKPHQAQESPSTVSEGPHLHALLKSLKDVYFPREGWTYEVEIIGRSREVLDWALTLLPDAQVECRTEKDDETGASFLFVDSLLHKHLCRFLAFPLPEEQKKTSKSQAKASEGVEDSTPSKNGKQESYQHYCSPPILIEATKLIAPVGLDVCHNEYSQWEARQTIDEAQDSLSFLYPWADMLRDDEIAPLNPPWNNMEPFVDKLLKEVIRGKQWLLIGPGGSTAAVWYQRSAKSCALRIEPDKRLKYYKEGVEDPNPRDATVLFYFGHQIAKVAAIYSRLGWLVTKRVEPEEYAAASELLRKEALDKRQQGLPGMATPEEKIQSEPEIKLKETNAEIEAPKSALVARDPKPENVPNVRTEEAPMFCAWEGSRCEEKPLDHSKFCGKHTPPPRLCATLKRVAKDYQKEGYEVTISTPRGTKPYSVMGFLGAIKDRDIEQDPAKRDEEEDKYTIDFIETERGTGSKKVVCTLTAVKKVEPKPAEARSPWASRAYAQLKACLTWEEFDTVYTKLEALATELGDRNDLIEFREELRGALPSQHNVKPEHLQKKEEPSKPPTACPKCHCELSVAPAMRKAKVGNKWVSCPTCVPVSTPKAPAPKRLAGKSEEPIKSPLKKNNPGGHLFAGEKIDPKKFKTARKK